jgi:hypothetical protein
LRSRARADLFAIFHRAKCVMITVTCNRSKRATPSSKTSLVIDYVNIFTHLLTYLCDDEALFLRFVTVLMEKWSNELGSCGSDVTVEGESSLERSDITHFHSQNN